MNKKELLIKILERLQGYWSSAEGVLLLIQVKEADDKLINGVLQIITDALHTTTVLLAKSKLQNAKDILIKIQKQESESLDQIEADALLAELEDART